MPGHPAVRDQLVNLIREGNLDLDVELRDDTSLIRSGLIDSLRLYNLAVWVEQQAGRKLDLASVDLPAEWDTIADILQFIADRRTGTARGEPC